MHWNLPLCIILLLSMAFQFFLYSEINLPEIQGACPLISYSWSHSALGINIFSIMSLLLPPYSESWNCLQDEHLSDALPSWGWDANRCPDGKSPLLILYLVTVPSCNFCLKNVLLQPLLIWVRCENLTIGHSFLPSLCLRDRSVGKFKYK